MLVEVRDRLPLSALLSQTLVAFTIEFDNEFEHEMPHRTSNYGATAGAKERPWLISMAMWVHFLRFIPAEGIGFREYQRATGLPRQQLKNWLTRLSRWWGYVALDPTGLIRPTAGGEKAMGVLRPLTATIEARWRERFGKDVIGSLFAGLRSLAPQVRGDAPDYLPILGFHMLAGESLGSKSTSEETIPALLSGVLSAFASEYENECGLSLAISANVLRLIADDGIRIREVRKRSGISKEAIAMAVKRLNEYGLAVRQSGKGNGREKILVPTLKGQQARATYHALAAVIEERWQKKFGNAVLHLRTVLEQIITHPRFCETTMPYPENWRARVEPPETLPHFPMVLHRGGFPDGS